MSNEAGITFGISPASNARLRNILGRFASLDGELRAGVEVEIRTLAEELERAIRDEFIKGGHDRTGKENDPSAWTPGYVHTIDTLKVETDGLKATITMGGGAPFVEYGTSPHVISARNGPYLTFRGGEGWARVVSVNHPGSAADDFIGRAVHDVDLPTFLGRLVSSLHIEQWGHAEDRWGSQYTGGEQFGGEIHATSTFGLAAGS